VQRSLKCQAIQRLKLYRKHY